MGGSDKSLEPEGVKWRRRAVPAVLVIMVAAAAGSAAAATGTSARQDQIRPENRFRPHIIGTPRVGASLKATRGSWTPSRSVVYTYRWLRCPAGRAKCVRIARAVRPHYTPKAVDVGTSLRVTVRATNAAGSASATSRPTRVVLAGGSARVVALWHMDETSGTVMDDSAGANNGALYQVALGVPGAVGRAYGFNGRNSYVSVPSASDLNPGTANIIVTIHLETTAVPGLPPKDADLVRKGTFAPTTSEYKVELQHSGQASCGFEGSAGYSELIAGPRLNDGKWHKVQCLKAPTAIGLVVDGKTFTQPANVGSISNAAPLVIGARPGGDWYAGNLDQVSIRIG